MASRASGTAEDGRLEVLTVTAGREKRRRRSTTVNIGGHAVLKLNDYTMEDGEPTISDSSAAMPQAPRGAVTAFTFFCNAMRERVADLPFNQRAAQLGQLWRHATPQERSEYDARAAQDRARFVRETAAYEVACEEHAAAVKAEREAREQAEWESLQAADAQREERAKAARAAKAEKARQPKKERQLSGVELRLQQSNASMKTEAAGLLQARSAFISKHIDVLRPFVLPSVLKKVSQESAKPAAIQPPVLETPPWIQGQLRGYQLEGLTWLLQQYNHGVSAILGDEMGLGKTLQTIAFLSSLKYEKKQDGPFLVVCPMSVLSSWMTEFRRWCPTFRTIKLHSSDASERDRMRRSILPDVAEYDCIVTTFEMIKSTAFNNSIKRIRFRCLVIDEGHVIKNETTLISQTLRKLQYSTSLLLTGTPLQNNMHELW